MKHPWLNAALMVLLAANFASAAESVQPTAPLPLQDAAIGAPTETGSHHWNANALSLTGGGAGIDVKGIDQCQYARLTREAGDFEIIARLADLSGEADAAAGIMVRADDAPSSAMVELSLANKDNRLAWKARTPAPTPGQKGKVSGSGIELVNKPPIWLRMVRLGKSFAVYKSRDGRLWVMISNTSGGQFAIEGSVQLGFFVASGAGAKSATATFDSIRVGPAHMGYRTSWVGNTFGCRWFDNHVSNGLSAMWVAPDGTCYTSSYWDEAGQPVTSYRDGRVARPLPVGTPQTDEGGITGDEKHVYVAANDRIVELDPSKADFAPRSIHLSVNLLSKKPNNCIVSGMASNGRELFVADSRDNLVRVVTLEPLDTYQRAMAANDGVLVAPEPVSPPADDPRAAPALVYQTVRVGEGVRYTLPGFTPGALFTVRAHLADFSKKAGKRRPMSVGKNQLDVFELAGGSFKPIIRDFPDYKANAKGEIEFQFGGYDGGVCAIEVLDLQGRRLLAINCGGPAVGDFKGESEERVERAFHFDRPGPMAFDKQGNLWIIQRGNDFPIGGKTTAAYPAAVKCYKTDGVFTGRQIADLVNPRAVAYDAAHDQLLVGENGPDLNVRIYGQLETTPALVKTFGQKGGIYGGEHPGLVDDPAAGGYERFAGVSGVGADQQGNLYVGGGFQGTDLRMFTSSGKLGWQLNSLMFCNTYDVDPASDGAELYGTYNHVHLDLSKSEPGAEQRYVGYNWNILRFGQPLRAGNSQALVRRLGPDKKLYLFTSGQGAVGEIYVFRYEGEQAIPCGAFGKELWIDANGDGIQQPEEVTKFTSRPAA